MGWHTIHPKHCNTETELVEVEFTASGKVRFIGVCSSCEKRVVVEATFASVVIACNAKDKKEVKASVEEDDDWKDMPTKGTH